MEPERLFVSALEGCFSETRQDGRSFFFDSSVCKIGRQRFVKRLPWIAKRMSFPWLYCPIEGLRPKLKKCFFNYTQISSQKWFFLVTKDFNQRHFTKWSFYQIHLYSIHSRFIFMQSWYSFDLLLRFIDIFMSFTITELVALCCHFILSEGSKSQQNQEQVVIISWNLGHALQVQLTTLNYDTTSTWH